MNLSIFHRGLGPLQRGNLGTNTHSHTHTHSHGITKALQLIIALKSDREKLEGRRTAAGSWGVGSDFQVICGPPKIFTLEK